ncbi:MAG: hypothetical protein QXO98_00610 [Sulfolobales archaeon]
MISIRPHALLVMPFLIVLVVHAGVGDIENEFLSIYKELVELSTLGVDVSDLIKELSVVLELIGDGSNESIAKAESKLKDVRARLEILKSRASYETLYMNLIKYSSITLLALVPVVTYFLLPRVYLKVWFKVRRRWVIRYGRTR